MKTKEINKTTGERILAGVPKSGRVWKSQKKRSSSMINVNPLRVSWNEKMKKRQEHKMVKIMETELKDAKNKEKMERRLRQEENKKRKIENSRKSEIVQVIKDPRKIKRMKKKQLRQIEKR
ncbi:CCDC86 (predicted) [Pycnogonum litorale]